MSDLDEMKKQIEDLRHEVDLLRKSGWASTKEVRRRIMVVEHFLCLLTDRPFRALLKNFGLWAQDEADRIDALDKDIADQLERGWSGTE